VAEQFADAKNSALKKKSVLELQEKLAAKERKLVEAQEAELKLRQEKLKFEEEKKAFELEVARRTDAVKQAVAKAKDEEFQMKELEFSKKEADWKRQVEEMKRKVEQSSQAQEVLLHLETQRNCFNEMKSSKSLARGGDIEQHVNSEMARIAGQSCWECSAAKPERKLDDKIKQDMLAAKADWRDRHQPHAQGISARMPRMFSRSVALAAPAASLVEVAAARRAIEGMHEKTELVYHYISGTQFKARVLAIVEGFKGLQEELEAEKRVTMKNWARREKQLERVIANTAGMYGDISGIIGKAMPNKANRCWRTSGIHIFYPS
jgi:hypothetical protein